MQFEVRLVQQYFTNQRNVSQRLIHRQVVVDDLAQRWTPAFVQEEDVFTGITHVFEFDRLVVTRSLEQNALLLDVYKL